MKHTGTVLHRVRAGNSNVELRRATTGCEVHTLQPQRAAEVIRDLLNGGGSANVCRPCIDRVAGHLKGTRTDG